MKFCELIADQLAVLGYTHFFFVGGGNIMHLTGALSKRLRPIPVIHEAAAVIASEYFNESSGGARSLALVTAGPGLTNAVTGISGSYLESRAALIIGGQVKTADLATVGIRQRGIQEIDGVAICRPITKLSKRLESTISRQKISEIFNLPFQGRKGPVFLEIPLNVQAMDSSTENQALFCQPSEAIPRHSQAEFNEIVFKFNKSARPVLLIGGGVQRSTANNISEQSLKLNLPLATTWNGADRVDHDHPCYIGRPNTWGQRSSNIIIQQSDLVISLGTRLGLQQTGFNWQSFVPTGQVIMVDIDEFELGKGHPELNMAVRADANSLITELLNHFHPVNKSWLEFCMATRQLVPLNEVENNFKPEKGFVAPIDFVSWLSRYVDESSIIIPCSSGSAFTCMMQAFLQKSSQTIITNKGLASMGYGLSGAIGAAIANPHKQTFLVEGDGGFSQNLQELGTVAANKLNLKIFIFDDSGHASIRMTQKSYFNGQYVGCDRETGLGLPNWSNIGQPWSIPTVTVSDLGDFSNKECKLLLSKKGPAIFVIRIHPEQTYYPKIASQVTPDGGMISAALHDMSPKLDRKLAKKVFKFIPSP